MDDEGYFWFDSPIDELDGDTEESRSDSPSLPSLPLPLQEQLACPDIGSSQRNQAMSMKEIDAKLNTLRTENFDLKLRLFYEKQNKGGRRSGNFRLKLADEVDEETQTALSYHDLEKLIRFYHRDGLKSYSSCVTQTESDVLCPKSSFGCQTEGPSKVMVDKEVQTDSIDSDNGEKSSQTDTLYLSSVSCQTVQPPVERDSQIVRPALTVIDQNQLNNCKHSHHNNHHQPHQPSPYLSEEKNRFSSLRDTKRHSLTGNDNLDYGISSRLNKLTSTSNQSLCSYQIDLKPMTEPTPKNVDYSECEYLEDVLEPSIMMTSRLSNRSHSAKKSKNALHGARSVLSKSCYSSCDDVNTDKRIKLNQFRSSGEEEILAPTGKPNGLIPSLSSRKIYDIISDQVKGHDANNNSNPNLKGRDLFSTEKLPYNGLQTQSQFHNLLDSTPEKGLTGAAYDSLNCHLSSPDLGIDDSDQDLNSSLRAYVSLGHYQLLRGNLNQLSSYLNCLDNLFRDCFILQSINLTEYSTRMKPNLRNLHQIVNLSRNICKNFSIEDENSISTELEKIRAKKESMEKAITRQLKQTDKLLRKAKLNLKEC